MMSVIDGLAGVVELIEAERAQAAEAARCATKRDTRARAMGQVAMANTLIAYLTGDVRLTVIDKQTGNVVIAC